MSDKLPYQPHEGIRYMKPTSMDDQEGVVRMRDPSASKESCA